MRDLVIFGIGDVARLAHFYFDKDTDHRVVAFSVDAPYRKAEEWTSESWLLNLLAWRANSGSFARRELEALIAERGDARRLFSLDGLLASIFQ